MFRSYRVVRLSSARKISKLGKKGLVRTALFTNGEISSDWFIFENVIEFQHQDKAVFPPGTWFILFEGQKLKTTGEILQRPQKGAIPPPDKEGLRLWVMEDHARQGEVVDLFPHVNPSIWKVSDGSWVVEATDELPEFEAATWMIL